MRAVDAWDSLLLVGHSPDGRSAAWITPPEHFAEDPGKPRTVILADAMGEHLRKIDIPASLQATPTLAEDAPAPYPMMPAWLTATYDWQKDHQGEWTLMPHQNKQPAPTPRLDGVATRVEAMLVDPGSGDSLALAEQLQDSMGGQDATRDADGRETVSKPWPPQAFSLTPPGLAPFAIAGDKTLRGDDQDHPHPRFLLGVSTREGGGEPGGSLVLTFAGDTPSLNDESGIASLHDRLEAWLNAKSAPHLWAKPSELSKNTALSQRLRQQLGWSEPQIADSLATLDSDSVQRALHEKGWLLFTKAGAFLLDTTSAGIPTQGMAWDLWAVYRLPSPAHTLFSDQIRNTVLFPAYGEYLTASLPAWLQAGQILDRTADSGPQPDGYLLRRPVDLFGLSVLSIRPSGAGYAVRVIGKSEAALAALTAALQGMKTPYVLLPAGEQPLKDSTMAHLHDQLGWSRRRIAAWSEKHENGIDHQEDAQVITNHGVITVSSIQQTDQQELPASLLTTSQGAFPGAPN